MEEIERSEWIRSENNDRQLDQNSHSDKFCYEQYKKYLLNFSQISLNSKFRLARERRGHQQQKNQQQVQEYLNYECLKLKIFILYNNQNYTTSIPMVSTHLTQYYYYAFATHNTQTGLLPIAVLPPYPFACFENWSLPTNEDSALGLPEKLTKDHVDLPSKPPGRSLSYFQPQKKTERQLTNNQQDGSDAFTEKRNIIPNNINHILAYVQRKSKSEKVITRAIARMQAEHPSSSIPFSTRRFYAYQTYLKGKIDIHVSKKTLILVASNLDLHSDIFSPEEQLFYNRVCRAAISHYLRNVAALTTLNSRRLRETSKKDHLGAQRHLLNFMKNIENQKILYA